MFRFITQKKESNTYLYTFLKLYIIQVRTLANFLFSFYIYYLKKPLEVENFFNNVELSSLLEYQIGHDSYEELYKEMMV